ncbi:hypothetical protein N7528_005952 [Penicillium herquei]|nr:hypothetical protein N7528_005952 [Penicillium herquei]
MTAGISPTLTLNDMGLMLNPTEDETGNFAGSQDCWPDLGPSLSVGESDHHHSALFVSPEQTFNLPHTSEITSQPKFADIAQATLLLPPAENLHKMNQITGGNDIGMSEPDFSRNDLSGFGHSLFAGVSDLEGDPIKMSQELLQILCEYPRLMLQHQFWSPFIHHNLYRCSQNGMAEPLGIALACVSAYVSSVESSFVFVENMINSQRERLVRDFRLSIDRPETCLAALHAVCIYQILGLFEQKYADGGNEQHQESSRKAAELHSFFLLKMTRCLCRVHKTAIEGNETSWSEWKFNESLRRNVFFVHIVNILAAEARSLQYDYFEPLDDDMILKMPLPAPEGVWRACSEDEWRVAREYAHSMTSTPRTLQDLIDSSEKDTLDVSSLQALTRMILECHKIHAHLKD